MIRFRIREAQEADISQMMKVRLEVNENQLSDPSWVTYEDCHEYIHNRGKGWVAETDDRIVGFAIADLKDDNVWALFMHPDFEKKGIGKKLHHKMLDWYFNQGKKKIWLSTDPNSRANEFYERQGWIPTEILESGEQKFEMSRDGWNDISSNHT